MESGSGTALSVARCSPPPLPAIVLVTPQGARLSLAPFFLLGRVSWGRRRRRRRRCCRCRCLVVSGRVWLRCSAVRGRETIGGPLSLIHQSVYATSSDSGVASAVPPPPACVDAKWQRQRRAVGRLGQLGLSLCDAARRRGGVAAWVLRVEGCETARPGRGRAGIGIGIRRWMLAVVPSSSFVFWRVPRVLVGSRHGTRGARASGCACVLFQTPVADLVWSRSRGA